MKLIKTGAAALNQTPLDWNNNKQNIIDAIHQAQKEKVSILCLPELCISGYGCDDAFYAPDLYKTCLDLLSDIAEECSSIITTVGLPIWFNNKIYNSSCLIADKRILGFVCKQSLPNYGIFYEDRWFQRWPAGVAEEIEIKGFKYPVGDLIFDLGGIKIGLEICEDGWVASRPAVRLYDRGVDVILNPSASPFSFRKFETRERLVIDASRTYGCSYIYTNLLGNESGRLIFDGDAMIASNGELLASSSRFSYASFTLTTAVIDIENTRIEQSKIKSPIPSNKKYIYGHFEFDDQVKPTFQKAALEPFEKGGFLKEEEFARAVCLGLFDYLRKSRSAGFTISLSGGADSCACTALCGLMIRLGDESIGLENFKKKLDYIPAVAASKNESELAANLITTIYQGTENSSSDTLNSAKSLADSIGARFYSININPLVESYTQLIEGALGTELTWQKNDIALQNIQARVRAPGVWLLANLSNHLLLATSNRSEVAVGYCTMDGDTAGSISPIAGINKSWLRTWLIWLEKTGCEVKGKHIRIEGLNKVNQLAPTAELRPLDKKQTDEADLMPYEVLNDIEKLAVKDKKSPKDSFIHIEVLYGERFEREQLYLWVTRFFRLWSRNQWKRERYAPGFHLDDHNLDPRSWCRFPILSGGYDLELQQLKDYFEGHEGKPKKRIGF
ncbi:NAD(+) synthase [Emticicia sp. CRIBPO]|uniref:NAD(+) synthase n=1 Tax=Emticicia sp. CRIBPO TaxID=2683258 RepID=UPI00141345F7|nr:NAD(+) synthase [Emticicia sp. CRIBPO]NBA86202.1 NAD(+) synthase [Emticicia sp. CRIBPO]